MDQRIGEVLGDHLEGLDDYPYQEELKTRYQEKLTAAGLVFPDTELEVVLMQWGVYNAIKSGFPIDTDSLDFDMAGFDPAAARELFQANRQAVDNAERLRSLVQLALVSRACAAAAEDSARQFGPNFPTTQADVALMTKYKQFVQIAMHLEEWSAPWQQLVAAEFKGQSLQLPLTAQTIGTADDLLADPLFTQLYEDYFGLLDDNWQDIYWDLAASLGDRPDVSGDAIRLAASIGQHYRTSPQAAVDLLVNFVQTGRLPAAVEWFGLIRAASAQAASVLTGVKTQP